MLLLLRDVTPNRFHPRLADGERAVSGLPGEAFVIGPTPVYPPGGICLYQTGDVRDGMVGGDTNEKMDVIASSVHAEGGTPNLTDDASEVGVQILFEIGFDECTPLFRAEDEMDEEVCGGVTHSFLSPLRGFACLWLRHPRL